MVTKEKLEHHISHLKERHEELDRRLNLGQPDYIEKVIKKEKLHIKDEIRICEKKIASLD